MEQMLLWGVLVLAAAAVALGVVGFVRRPKAPDFSAAERHILEEMRRYLAEELRGLRQEMSQSTAGAVQAAARTQADTQRQLSERQDTRLKELREQLVGSQETLQRNVNAQMASLDERFAKFSMHNDQKLDAMRKTLEERVAAMQAGNEKKLEEMRHTVDEKLQKTLDERLKQSFGLVNESLDKVQRGLGEMQTLATGVGDLKKVLTNVKTKGILGEIQLGAILEEILSHEQYAVNVETVRGTGRRVEYAVKLPGDGDGKAVWLPIDAKFPNEAYANLLSAQEEGNKEAADAAGRALEARVRLFARDIHEKYVHVPETTEFAIMFLPMEGLYAEVVRRGLVEKLQSEYKINIAGPTTMAALLNSLQMGFRTLAIQKRSGEVWQVLGEVKSEFAKFSDYLMRTKQHIEQAGKDIDHLIGTRTNVMQRKLRGVTSLPGGEEEAAGAALPSTAEDAEEVE